MGFLPETEEGKGHTSSVGKEARTFFSLDRHCWRAGEISGSNEWFTKHNRILRLLMQ
jgi:hypothetical protein